MTAKRKKIILIDGNSLVYRAFFALPTSISTRTGQATNAVYGFTTMLFKLLKEEKPDAVAVAFDRPKPTFRHIHFEEYKAHRAPTPTELPSQIPISKQVLHAMNIPCFEMDGFEADDILCTLGLKAKDDGYDVLIVTGDKDALQLVQPHIQVMTTKRGITDTFVYDKEDVIERFGIEPKQIPDLLGLKGDTSDNIPGVPGIGEKTAAKLLQQFGTVEELYKRIDEVSQEKLRENLVEHKEQAEMSKELAVLVPDVPLKIDPDALAYHGADAEKLRDLFAELEFRTLMRRVDEVASHPVQDALFEEAPPADLAVILFKDGLPKEAMDKAAAGESAFAVTAGEMPEIAIAFEDGTVYKGPFDQNVSPYLSSTDIRKGCYDLKSILSLFAGLDLTLAGSCYDVMLAAYLIDPGRRSYALNELVSEYLGEYREGANYEPEEAAFLTARLKSATQPLLEERNLGDLFHIIELPLSGVLSRMERTGVAIDCDQLNALSEELATGIGGLEKDIYELAGEEFNINSPQQLGNILFEKLAIKSHKKKKTKTGYSTSYDVLVKLIDTHPIIEKVLAYRELAKIKGTYVDALPPMIDERTGRIHTYFNQVGTATGRLASEKPNLQNIPVRGEWGSRIRKAFIAGEKGWGILSADYSQIELRILAHLAKDPKLMDAFERGEDIHASTAKAMLGLKDGEVTADHRRIAKVINFGLMYGMSVFGLAEQLGVPENEAQGYMDRYFEQYPDTRAFIDDVVEEARNTGFVTTVLGRIRYIPELSSGNYMVRRLGERLAINTVVQGSAADIIKLAMINIDLRLKKQSLASKMVLQIHDELVFEVPESEQKQLEVLVKNEMEGAYGLSVPLEVNMGFGASWGEAHI